MKRIVTSTYRYKGPSRRSLHIYATFAERERRLISERISADPNGRRWLIERHRICPVIRALHRCIDPLFAHAGLVAD